MADASVFMRTPVTGCQLKLPPAPPACRLDALLAAQEFLASPPSRLRTLAGILTASLTAGSSFGKELGREPAIFCLGTTLTQRIVRL